MTRSCKFVALNSFALLKFNSLWYALSLLHSIALSISSGHSQQGHRDVVLLSGGVTVCVECSPRQISIFALASSAFK